MPRIREVKPEFFLDEQLAEVSHAARLLFIGLWTLCDREGRLEDRPARIKAQVFPYGPEDVDALLTELAEHSGQFICRYETEGRGYLQVRSFAKHQRPHPKETASRLPPCPAVKRNGKPGKNTAHQNDHAAANAMTPKDIVEKPGNFTASREKVGKQDDPSGGSMGTWAHGSMGDGTTDVESPIPVENAELKPDDRPDYARAVWTAFTGAFGVNREMSSAEFHLISKWMDRALPLPVVLTGVKETGGKPRNLYASEKAVERAAEYWHSAVRGAS